MKKLGIGLAGFLGLVLIAIIAIPFFVDVDQFRPHIVKLANEQINGELAIGKLSLSLWGKIEIDIDGISLKDQRKNQLVKVGEAYVHLPFSSLLSGKPHLVLRLSKPNINVVMDKNGKLNLLTIVKESKGGAKAKEPPKDKPKVASKGETQVEIEQKITAMIKAARIDFEMNRANFSFVDKKGGLEQKFSNFNLSLSDISLTRTIGLKLSSDISTRMGKSLSVTGPFRINGKIKPTFVDFDFKKVLLSMTLSFDDIAFDIPGTFTKPAGKPTNIKMLVEASPNDIDLQKLEIRFLEVVMKAKAQINNLTRPPEKLTFNLVADYPGIDLKLNANLQSFAKPKARVSLASKGIDLDVLFPPPPGGRKPLFDPETLTDGSLLEGGKDEKKGEAQPVAAKSAAPKEPPADVDGSLVGLRTDDFLKALDAGLKVRIASVKGFELDIQNIAINTSFKQLVASLDRFNFGVFGGTMQARAKIDLMPAMPRYDFSAKVSKWNLNDAVASQLPFVAKTIKGLLSFAVKGKGESLNSDKLLKNLKAKGSFSYEEATFSSLDIGKILDQGLGQLAEKAKKKIPGLGDYLVKKIPARKSRFKFIGSDFVLKDGVFQAPNFRTTAYEKEGLDISGATTVGLIDDRLAATWAFVDTYNQTGLFDVGINKEVLKRKIEIKHIFSEDAKPVKYPVTVGCKLSEPCFKYDSMTNYLIGVAVNNVSGKAQSLLDAEKAKLKARLEAEKRKLEAKALAEKRKLQAKAAAARKKAEAEVTAAKAKVEAEQRQQRARLAAEKKKANAKVAKEKKKANDKVAREKKKARDKAKKQGEGKAKNALKKLGF